MQQMNSSPCWLVKFTFGLFVAVLGITAGAFFSLNSKPAAEQAGGTMAKLLLPEARPLSAFQLTAHDLQPLNLARLKGKWTFIYFGYTHCPDICPTTLSELARAYSLLEKQSPQLLADTQVVFVSVDGQRDTPQILAGYTTYFNPRFLGATGSSEELEALAKQLGAKFSISKDPLGQPVVNHSSDILLIDPQVRYYARFSAPHYADVLSSQYAEIRNHYEGKS